MPTSSLAPYGAPLTARDVRHLLRRTGFGASLDRVAPLVGLSAPDAVARLLDEAAAAPALVEPAWYATPAAASADTNARGLELRGAWIHRMLASPVRERLTLFWHNHLVTGWSSYYHSQSAWSYLNRLHTHALGNVRTLLDEIGVEPAMLRYLNGNGSHKNAPNQNYARELYELFALGQTARDGSANYTEADVAETARAFTGYVISTADPIRMRVTFDETRHDTGTKTIFGRTGPWSSGHAMALLFSERGPRVAEFIVRKLLAFYVAAVPDPAVEAALAAQLAAGGFEVRPVLATLWASEHFFDPGHRGALVKSPIDVFLGLIAEINATSFDPAALHAAMAARGLDLLSPPDVAGWDGFNPPNASGLPGLSAWYQSDDYAALWSGIASITDGATNVKVAWDPLRLLALASDPNDPFRVALALAEAFVAVPLQYASVPPNDAPFTGDPTRLPPEYVRTGPRVLSDLAKAFLGAMPHYEWASRTDASKAQRVQLYVKWLMSTLPEALVF